MKLRPTLLGMTTLALIFTGCSSAGSSDPSGLSMHGIRPSVNQLSYTTPSNPLSPTPTQFNDTDSRNPSALPALSPDDWTQLPVIPSVSDNARRIYLHGLELGNNPLAFSIIGDCNSTSPFFLSSFDEGTYNLGAYNDLQAAIDHFAGSFQRGGFSVLVGASVSTILSPLCSDPQMCFPSENPIECEYNRHKPIISIIQLGTNGWDELDIFESRMRRIIEISIEHGVVPILATKADNREGDHGINRTLALLALEYDLPLWNFWLALQPLPNHGMQSDGIHLSWGNSYFDDPNNMESGWAIRNLTALQALDAVWRGLAQIDDPDTRHH
jgi:hypothetical protein